MNAKTRTLRSLLLLSISLQQTFVCDAFSSERVVPFAEAKAAVDAAAATAATDVKVKTAEATFQEKLTGFGFAGGIAAVFMNGEKEVANAQVNNGILNVDYKSDDRLGGILETHYLFGDLTVFGGSGRKAAKLAAIKSAIEGGQNLSVSDFAPGIMVGAELGENAIRSLGLGVIFSWRRIQVDSAGKLTPKLAFNIGIMALIEQNVKMLASGFEDGKPLPTGQTAVRFKEDSRTGFAVTFSAGF
jgi:hypothetical protein